MVEKTYLKEMSVDFKNQSSLFNSDAELQRVSGKLESSLKAGVQKSFPRKLNEILRDYGVLVMRTEHETDIVDSKSLQLVADQFGYDLEDFELGIIKEADVIAELKALNGKNLKKAFETAKLVSRITQWNQVPSVYAAMCNEIYRQMETHSVKL